MCVKKGKNDTEVVRIEGEKSGEKPCEMGTEGKGEKEQAFSKRLQTWKTCAAAQIYHKHPNSSALSVVMSAKVFHRVFSQGKNTKKRVRNMKWQKPPKISRPQAILQPLV